MFDGISYPDNRIHEDEARTFQILYKVKKLVHIKRAYYYYFQNKNSIVGKKISKVNIQQLDAYCDKLCFYREYKENQLWQIAARHAMHMYCYMQKRFDDNNLGVSVRKERQGMYLEYELESSKEIEKVAFSLKLEIFFFLNLAGLYYKIWKMKKKVICRDE